MTYIPGGGGASSSGVLAPVKAVIDTTLASGPLGTVASSVSDDVSLTTGDRVLLVAMANLTQNGPWIYNSAGAWSRPTDYAQGASIAAGISIPVDAGGTNYGRTKWDLGTTGTITVGTTTTSWYQQTFNYNRRRLPYAASNPSALRLWWRLDQPTNNLVNQITANGTHQFTVTDGGARGVLAATPDDSSSLGTGGLLPSGNGSPTLYCATADTAFQPSTSTSFVINAWIQPGPYTGTGDTYYVGFQQGTTNVLRLGTTASNTKFSGALRVNGTVYTVTSPYSLVLGERYLVSLSLSPNDSGVRLQVNGYEVAYTQAPGGGTVTWAPSTGTRRWFLFNDPNNTANATFAQGVLEEVRCFNTYDINSISAERAEYLRGIGAAGRT